MRRSLIFCNWVATLASYTVLPSRATIPPISDGSTRVVMLTVRPVARASDSLMRASRSPSSGTDVVRIELKKVNGELHLDVRDFGCGFKVESVRKRGFGLLGMMERVRLLDGECHVHSELDTGTRISVRLPIPVAGDEEG